jgi:hypothetical protein
MHDLESIFWVLFWICIQDGTSEQSIGIMCERTRTAIIDDKHTSVSLAIDIRINDLDHHMRPLPTNFNPIETTDHQ